ncbi:HlyD family secretion protein [Pseudomonas sp. KCJK8927]|uniref:HlyD family secretion protein n=1 Tax=Pseudomonas sp. KCJK8927 TaxID=3344560 RepID=UPI003905A68A
MTHSKLIKASCVIIAGVLIAVLLTYLNRHESDGSKQKTDDAYVQADFTVLAARVSGNIEKVLVEENQKVSAGQTLATIDDRDFLVALNSARARAESAESGVVSLRTKLLKQETLIKQARAVVISEKARLKLATANQIRYKNLASDGSGTVQAKEHADAQRVIQYARTTKSTAALQAAVLEIDIIKADLQKAEADSAQARAAVAMAELNYSYTKIVAPFKGTIGKKSVRVGAFAAVGEPLLAVVPLDAMYVTANYRETQLAHVKEGQEVNIEVDALPGVVLKGYVESLGPATGVSYSTIAPHNATGNFTKIVQRIPVRIAIRPNQSSVGSLRVGMSVQPTILTY